MGAYSFLELSACKIYKLTIEGGIENQISYNGGIWRLVIPSL